MSVRESETEEEEEEVSLDHFIHEHPLTLIRTNGVKYCHGCGKLFLEEAAYGCKRCGNGKMLHQECAEAPQQIRHSMHPQHTLAQKEGDASRPCAVCDEKIGIIGYFCTSSAVCDFQIHLRCAPAMGVIGRVGDEQVSVSHPSHPQHQLILVTRRHSFRCDACGETETGRSYVCVACQYWIHERCAKLPATLDYRRRRHHHPLSLVFSVPIEYFNFFCVCDVCRQNLPINRWVYHCQSCRYIVHIKCAISPPPIITLSEDADADAADDAQGFIQFPINDVHEELIKPFVIRERGEMLAIPRDDQEYYCFPLHHHRLSLVSSSISISEINDDEDEDEDIELACDACTMPIFPSSSSSSSSASSYYYYKYMSCGECKYFLHLACFHLPPELLSHPLHKADHKLILEACPKLEFWMRCSICDVFSNGLLYACAECNFKADIRCASLPTAIKHRAHPHHHLHSKFEPKEVGVIKNLRKHLCRGCPYITLGHMIYECGGCDFNLCSKCALLPPANKHELEKHVLPLRHDAHLDHPGEFYCDGCERQMDPKQWMYHCRSCDTSFHPSCFPATSGDYRNFKFGQRYGVSPHLHPHPLTFQLLETKLRCDVCRCRIYGDDDVDQRGFHCSACNFFMCLEWCGWWRRRGAIWAID